MGSGETRPRGIVLIGLRGSGKSTVGGILAELLQMPFRDSDEEITRRHGHTPGAILRDQGEAELRCLEKQVISDLAASAPPGCIFALGGGVPCDPDNRAALGQWSAVLLDAPDGVLEERIQADQSVWEMAAGASGREISARPPLTDLPLVDEIAALRRERWPDYLAMNPRVVDAACGDARTVADEVRRSLASAHDPSEESGRRDLEGTS